VTKKFMMKECAEA